MDPSLAEDGVSLKILGNTAEGLVGYDGNGQLTPRLASQWKVSSDGLRYEFLIRDQAFWSDGVALKAEDFKVGIERTLHPKTAAKLGELLSAIASVAAPDDKKLVITLKKRIPYFIQVLSLPVASPQRRDILDKNSGRWPLLAPSASAYFIAERKPDQYWLLKKNPYYPLEKGSPAQVRLVQVAEEGSALALFEQNQLDLLGRVPPLEQSALQKKGLLSIKPFWATFYLGFNTRKKTF